MAPVTPNLKRIIQGNIDEIEQNNFGKAISEAIRCDELAGFLEIMFQSGIDISVDAVTKELTRYYIEECPSLSADEKAKKIRQYKYAINQYQNLMMKMLVADFH